MTLQQDRANGAPGLWPDVRTGDQLEDLLADLPADAPCPDDCHFCSGPETD
ncbi:MAG: hypothetical protein U1D68_10670 [Arthrobacter sp.]|nr:hypothetical protein [Arthrobacter sp.]MDZ4351366.1 hypothetical protein [Arthrobacter sp.]